MAKSVILEILERFLILVLVFLPLWMLAILTWRPSISQLVIPCFLYLAISQATPRLKFKTAVVVVLSIFVLLALVPIDLRVVETGELGITYKRYLWGYPSPEALELSRRGEIILQGCMGPILRARGAVVVTF